MSRLRSEFSLNCIVLGCSRAVKSNANHGLCEVHFAQKRGERCNINACNGYAIRRGFCGRHYTALRDTLSVRSTRSTRPELVVETVRWVPRPERCVSVLPSVVPDSFIKPPTLAQLMGKR